MEAVPADGQRPDLCIAHVRQPQICHFTVPEVLQPQWALGTYPLVTAPINVGSRDGSYPHFLHKVYYFTGLLDGNLCNPELPRTISERAHFIADSMFLQAHAAYGAAAVLPTYPQ